MGPIRGCCGRLGGAVVALKKGIYNIYFFTFSVSVANLPKIDVQFNISIILSTFWGLSDPVLISCLKKNQKKKPSIRLTVPCLTVFNVNL